MNKSGSVTLNVIVGILVVGGGIAYFFNQSSLGALVAGLGLLLELAVKYFKG